MRALALFVGAGLFAAAGCSSPRPATEMVIEVDGDPGVRDRTARVRVEVYGRARLSDPFPADAIHALPYAVPVVEDERWGPRVVLVPEARDPLRSYRAVAIALDSMDREITRTSLISGYVDGVTLHFRLFLQSSCEGVDCEPSDTCRDGECVDAYVDPDTLVDGGLFDAGGAMDATLDGGPDTGPPVCGDCDDGLDCTIDRCVDGVCRNDPGCDDFIACTVDSCATDGSGTCVHLADSGLCTGGGECAEGTCIADEGCSYVPDASECDDDNDCTMDSCALVTGCTHTDLSGVSCDDGLLCNGIDSCMAGECMQHAGRPCPMCDETLGCTGCNASGGCPANTTGLYSACTSTGPCTGMRTATTTTWSCNLGTGICQSTVTTETDTNGCRAMDGTTCASETCTNGSCGGFADACDESGTYPRECVAHECTAGVCGDRSTGVTNVSCPRDTDGVSCANDCEPGYSCSYGSTCLESGTSSRTCNPSYCGSELCRAGTPYEEPNPAGNASCDRDTDGVSCGTCMSCMTGSCRPSCGIDAGPPFDGGLDAGFDAWIDVGTGASVDAGRPDGGRGSYTLVINEIDYDQGTTDPTEFIEILNTGSFPVVLDGLALVLINGTTISPAVEHARATLAGTLIPGAYAVITSSSSTILVTPPNLAFTILPPTQTIGDGGTDGVILWDTVNRRAIDALSYEGAITDATIMAPGDAMGVTLVEGTATPVVDMGAMSMCRRPNGMDTNNASADWATCSPSPGGANL